MIRRTKTLHAAGRELAFTTPLTGATACEPVVDGLFWFSDASGAFDARAEAAYLLPEGAAGPVLGIARLTGETCDQPITWRATWTPQTPDGPPPLYNKEGSDLIVYPSATTAPGVLMVSAEFGGRTFGPILLTILLYQCAGYYGAAGSGCATLDSMTWDSGGKSVSESGSSWSHVGTITGSFPEGTVFEWSFTWSGDPGDSPTFVGDGTSTTISREGNTGAGNATAQAKITAPGCEPFYTDFLTIAAFSL